MECPICLELDVHLFECKQCKMKAICEQCYVYYYLKNDIRCPLCRYSNYDQTFIINTNIEYTPTNFLLINRLENKPCIYSLISLFTLSIVMCVWSLV